MTTLQTLSSAVKQATDAAQTATAQANLATQAAKSATKSAADGTVASQSSAGTLVQVNESRDAAAGSASAASASAAASAGSAAAASASAADVADVVATNRLFDTKALGEAGTSTGQTYFVRQTSGKGAYEYSRTAGGSTFLGVRPIGSRAREVAYERILKNTLAPPAAGAFVRLWGQNAWEWDNRLIPNEASFTPPTLNWLPDPFNPIDEDGGTTPARIINTASTTDPLGGNNALELTVTGANQQVAFYVSTEPAVPATDIRVRIYTKFLSGGNAYKLGTTSGLAVTAGASWDASSLETTIAGFTGATAIGFSSATGNTAASVAVAGAGIYDPLAGDSATLPTLAKELASQNAGHLKPSLAYPGSAPLSLAGSIRIDGANALTPMISIDAAPVAMTNYSFGGVFQCDAMPVSSSGSALACDFHSTGATNASAQIGVYGATDAVAGRPGRIYVNPQLGASVTAINHYFPGEGKHTIYVTVNNGDVMLYVDGVPAWLGVQAGWAAPAIARLILGAYTGTKPRRKTLTPYVGEIDGLVFWKNKTLTQAEVTAEDKHARARLRLYGLAVAPRKVCLIGGGDSLCAFSPSWFWQLGECTQLAPRLHGHLEAVGGTRLRSNPPGVSDWIDPVRYGQLVQRIQAADAAGYDEVWFYILPGANDSIDSWIDNGYDYHPWKTEFLAYIAGIKALSPKVRVAVLSMLPRPGVGDEIRLEQQRQAWNDDLRANYLSMGFNRFIDTGLGTERVSLTGVVTAETIAGGTLMGNWRVSQGAKTSTRNPAATLTLSALSGASFTATAPAGTFTSGDMYRVVTATAGGEAVITGFATAGGIDTVTLSTTNYTPTPWPSEPAAITTRNQITRAAFLALSITSGNWTVKNDSNSTTRLYQTDGIHPGYPGGRMLAEVVWPHTKAIQDVLAGLAV